MARCACGNATCSCVITAGDGVTVVGNGSPTRPYEIAIDSALQNIKDVIQVADTPTLDMTMIGTGTPSDKLTIYGVTKTRMSDLTDVSDPEGPQTGDVPIWQATGHWEFRPLPSGPPTTVQVGNGITGDGSAGTPVSLRNSGVWGSAGPGGNGFPGLDKYGSDQTLGQPVYIDSAGVVRASPITLPLDAKNSATAFSGDYPVGTSIMGVSAGWFSGFPGGTVVTWRRANTGDGHVGQMFFPAVTTPSPVLFRVGTSTVWTAWGTVTEDTGWVNITPASGTGTCQYRCVNGVVSVRANLSGMTSLATGASGAISAAGAVPTAYRPAVSVYAGASGGGAFSTLAFVDTGGNFSQWNNSGSAITVGRATVTYLKE